MDGLGGWTETFSIEAMTRSQLVDLVGSAQLFKKSDPLTAFLARIP